MSKYTEDDLKKELETKEYEYGFYTDIESDTLPVGLNEEIIIAISKKKEEPEWMTEWRLDAFKKWKEMSEPEWANVKYEKPDLQKISYYSAPSNKPKYNSLDEVDPELLETFKKLGISVDEQKKLAGVAVDVVIDSVSVASPHSTSLCFAGRELDTLVMTSAQFNMTPEDLAKFERAGDLFVQPLPHRGRIPHLQFQ